MNLTEVKERTALEPYEITDIEQVKSVETQAGIAIRGLSAEVEPKGTKKVRYVVSVLGEIEILAPTGLMKSVEILAVCYGDQGQVCGSAKIEHLRSGEVGGSALNHEIECKSPAVKLRVFPKIWV